MKRIYLIILLAVIFSACRKGIHIWYGIRKPAIENHKSLSKYLDAKNIEINEFYVLRNLKGLQKMSEFNLGIPDGLFFNQKGYAIPYTNDSINCNAGVGYFMGSLAKSAELKVDSAIQMKELTPYLVDSKSLEGFENKNLSADTEYFIYIFWARYIGRLNKVKVQKWVTLFDELKSKNDHVEIFYVNIDFQESWDVDTKTMKELKITK